MRSTNWRTRSSGLEHWPICSVHLWFDREITELDHAVLLDREIHWLYNKSKLQPWRKLKGSYVELVVSASRSFAAKTREEAIEQSVRELGEFFPEVKNAKLEKAALIKEVRATFGVPPGIDGLKAACCGPLAKLLSGRRLDCHRLALDDGKRGEVRAFGGGSAVQGSWRTASCAESRSQAEGDYEAVGCWLEAVFQCARK